jgi:16S rRNA (cytidine1402-2'-O)-methyltransferase
VPGTLILFEAPTRVAATLADIAAVLGDRQVGLARELTKIHETLRSGTAAAMAAALTEDDTRGECVLLVGAAIAADVTDATIADELRAALATASINAAVRQVTELLGVSKNRVYAIALTVPRDPAKGLLP